MKRHGGEKKDNAPKKKGGYGGIRTTLTLPEPLASSLTDS